MMLIYLYSDTAGLIIKADDQIFNPESGGDYLDHVPEHFFWGGEGDEALSVNNNHCRAMGW